ncbi:hypothetical protein T484DRAFT_1972664, partial [Baffinella frigidus]
PHGAPPPPRPPPSAPPPHIAPPPRIPPSAHIIPSAPPLLSSLSKILTSSIARPLLSSLAKILRSSIARLLRSSLARILPSPHPPFQTPRDDSCDGLLLCGALRGALPRVILAPGVPRAWGAGCTFMLTLTLTLRLRLTRRPVPRPLGVCLAWDPSRFPPPLWVFAARDPSRSRSSPRGIERSRAWLLGAWLLGAWLLGGVRKRRCATVVAHAVLADPPRMFLLRARTPVHARRVFLPDVPPIVFLPDVPPIVFLPDVPPIVVDARVSDVPLPRRARRKLPVRPVRPPAPPMGGTRRRGARSARRWCMLRAGCVLVPLRERCSASRSRCCSPIHSPNSRRNESPASEIESLT